MSDLTNNMNILDDEDVKSISVKIVKSLEVLMEKYMRENTEADDE